MHNRVAARAWVAVSIVFAVAQIAPAQSLGIFRWQLQPYCNVVTVNVVQQGSIFAVDGFDDQCGAAQRALLVGTATLNPDGTVGFGLSIVTAPGGRAVHVDARVAVASLSGPWSDSAGNSGTFAFNASTGGSARPAPASSGAGIPAPFSLLTEGGFVARGTGGSGAIPATGGGVRMMWYPQQAAFRAGAVNDREWDPGNVGFASAAFGSGTSASGQYGFAAGQASAASGPFATALGLHSLANGYAATAMGQDTTASGLAGTAIGQSTMASGTQSLAGGFTSIAAGSSSLAFGVANTQALGTGSLAIGSTAIASGDFSRSLGFNTVATGVSSTAIGVGTQAAGLASITLGTFAAATAAAPGSFVFGDRSTVGGGGGALVTSSTPNQFLVRATGGVAFYTNAGLTSGLALASGGSQWLGVSDVNMKEHFRELAPNEVLAKIAALPITEWSYKAQDAAIRHIGPMAQDFHAAFGLGEDPLRIGTLDADGVALAAIKALEARTRELIESRDALARANETLLARVARLELLLQDRK